jgi:putative FmdB family regulatory protein
MPIYEYECRACEHQFEFLVRPPAFEEPSDCPSCHGKELTKLHSLFAVDSEGARQQHLQQARKAGAKARRDQHYYQLEVEKHIQEEHDH